MRGSGVEDKTEVESALEISEDTFDELKVGVSRIMHVNTDLLSGIRNFGSSESNILESSGEASIVVGIRIWWTARGCKFGFGVYGSGGRMAITHSSSGKNI
jgi:hypothetical protein